MSPDVAPVIASVRRLFPEKDEYHAIPERELPVRVTRPERRGLPHLPALSRGVQLGIRRRRRHRRNRARPTRHEVVQPRGRGARVLLRRHEVLVRQDRELPRRPGRSQGRHGARDPAPPLPVLVHRAGAPQDRGGSRPGDLHAPRARPRVSSHGGLDLHDSLHQRRHGRRRLRRGRARLPRAQEEDHRERGWRGTLRRGPRGHEHARCLALWSRARLRAHLRTRGLDRLQLGRLRSTRVLEPRPDQGA